MRKKNSKTAPKNIFEISHKNFNARLVELSLLIVYTRKHIHAHIYISLWVRVTC